MKLAQDTSRHTLEELLGSKEIQTVQVLSETDLPTGVAANSPTMHISSGDIVTLWPGEAQQIVVEKSDQTSELVDHKQKLQAREIPEDPVEMMQAIAEINFETREDAAFVLAMFSKAVLGEIDPSFLKTLLQDRYPESSHRRPVISEPFPSTLPVPQFTGGAQASHQVMPAPSVPTTPEQASLNPIEAKKNRIIVRFFQLINFLPGKIIRTVTYNGKSLQIALEYFPHKQTGLLTIGKDAARQDNSLSWKIDRHYLLPASNQNHLYPQYRLDFGFDHIFDFLCAVLDKA